MNTHCYKARAGHFNPKSEGRNPKSERNPKPETRNLASRQGTSFDFFLPLAEIRFGLRTSAFFRISGIRISNLSLISRCQSFNFPIPLFQTRVKEPVVQPVSASLPKLDVARHHAEAAPE